MYGRHYIGANDTYALDSAQDNKLVFAAAEDLAADRRLDFVVGDANRKIDLTPTADHGLMYDLASTTWKSKDIVDTLSAIFKTDGSRDLTGQLKSTYAAGAPFVIVDSTVVLNLNSDLLDGNHASAFALSAHAHTFLEITDTPASYLGNALKLVRVNAAATALEFSAAVTTTFVALTDVPASYATHGDKTVMVNPGATALGFRGPWLDQDVRIAATPIFAGLTVTGDVTLSSCSTFAISDSPGNTSVTMDGTLSVASTCNIVGLFTANSQIVSTLADGGAMPLNVTSLVKCANLNADLLDGKHVGTSGNVVPLLDGANTWSANQLLGTTSKLLLDSSSQYLHAVSSTTVVLNAASGIQFAIGGISKVSIANAAISPLSSNAIDVGAVLLEFKDGFFAGKVRAKGFLADGDPGSGGSGTIVWTGTAVAKSFGAGSLPAMPSGYAGAGEGWIKVWRDGVEGVVPFWKKT